MANEVRLQEGHPLSENLRPIKVGGEVSSLEIADIDKGARIRGNLEITGSIPTVKTRRIESDGITNIITVDADGTAAHLTFNVDGDIICKPISSHLYIRSGSVDTIDFDCASAGTGASMTLHSILDTGDYFKITTVTHGVTTIATVDDDGNDDADLSIDVQGDILIRPKPGGAITLQENDGTAWAPSADAHAATKKYVDAKMKIFGWMPFYFDAPTTGYTYFRHADDTIQSWEWDTYDTDDDTTVGNTIGIRFGDIVSGYLIPQNCNLESYKWAAYQSQNVTGDIHVQLWTGTPATLTTITLRSTDNLTSNRAFASATGALDVDLGAGDMIYIAIQNNSGTSGKWAGAVSFAMKEQ